MRRYTLALLAVATSAAAATPYEQRCAHIVATQGRVADTRRLHELFDASWAYALDEFPELATAVGAPGGARRWTDRSLAAIARRKREAEAPARVLASIDRRRLPDPDRLSYDLFRRDVEETLAARRFPRELLPVTQLGGVQQDAARVLAQMPATTVAQLEDVAARLRALPAAIAQTLALLDAGRAAGVTPPRITLRDVPQQVENQIPADPLASPLLHAFTRLPDTIPVAAQEELRAGAVAAYTEQVVPAFRRLHDYLADTYVPAARESVALADLPDGTAWYAFDVAEVTTTTLTPQAIHDLGLAEVARIRAAMEAVVAESGFTGDLSAFMKHLRTDARFFCATPAELLAAHRDIAKRADAGLVRLFGRLPRLPYGVAAVPAYAERAQPAAYYEAGSLAAGRAAYFYANTSDLRSRPRWAMEALTLHEAVPGHHLQIALAQELEGVPEFRRHGGYTAFVEGWGLYAEGLGAEMGFYQDAYSRFGRLTYEMWRAVRLVVDTGLHALGWSRQQAIDYFQAETGKTGEEAVVEVDRYIVWPAQALAYKIGELTLQRLRHDAERARGAAFDVRAFHDEVLREGALPLDVLEARLRAWVVSRPPDSATR